LITVKVADLLKMVNDLHNDEIEFVDISLLSGVVFDGVITPPSLHFCAYDGTGGGIDYESIDEVKISSDYKFE
jgi:hypothetical protein